ncbi:helix-turn-helix domain-containing protein [Streptomyces rubiginosohelvolus]|uniref:helix-turn-helix domain-containing protein n=1 Tax=Streptomyces rubiginosohelvolus TaxID=67362 RepID=UPI0036ED535F
MTTRATNQADVIPLRPLPTAADPAPQAPPREPLWRDLVGEVLRRERRAQGRTLKDVSEASRISMAYLSEVERGRKEASSEVLAAAAQALGLSLADVLALAGELFRLSQARDRNAGASRTGRRRSGPERGPKTASSGTVRLAA